MGHTTTATVIVLCLAAITALATPVVRYDGHKIVRLQVDTVSSDVLRSLRSADNTPTAVEVLSHEGLLIEGVRADVRVSPDAFSALTEAGVALEVTVPDLQQRIEAADEHNRRRRSGDWFEHFHPYDDIVDKVRELVAAHSDIATFLPSVASSVQGRQIPAVRLGTVSDFHNTTFLLSGIHAREWIGPAVLLWSLRSLLNEYAANTNGVREILDKQTVYIVPCYNPDGYEYSRTVDRMWRKNRGKLNGTVVGIDLNRNFDDGHWGIGASDNTSEETYMGPHPWSEPETRGISNWILSMKNRKTFIDFHSFAGQILRPYGWSTADCPDEHYLKWVGDTMSLLAGNNKSYVSMKGMDLYPVGGATDSWAYEAGHILHSYTIEIAGNDFVVNESDIPLRGPEMYPAVRFLLGLTAGHSIPFTAGSSGASPLSVGPVAAIAMLLAVVLRFM
eukprot:m51a1_g2187 putative mast cell carboxypeptidase a (447) ;mRNA; r:115262-116969